MRLFIISNRLPVKINDDESGHFNFVKSEGGLATGLGSLDMPNVEKHWIGWPGMEVEKEKDKKDIVMSLNKLNYHPIFLTKKQIHQYYDGYCNSTLWPLFHYFFSFIEYDNRYWNVYKDVNRLFCNAAKTLIRPGDIVWVQDYHLMLLPQMLRDEIKGISIGYFHHIPFPSYELFRVLPERAEILKGLLGADLIGFHTHDYMRHFASSIGRVLKLPFKLDCISMEHHKSYVNAFPMGINYDLYHDTALKPEIKEKVKELKRNYGENSKLILSVDRLDYSKGIIHRIKGFALFLKNHPEYNGKVSLVMIIVPSRDMVGRYAKLKREIDQQIGAINGKYSNISWTPVYYFYHSFQFDDLISMYSMAEIALVTPLRDGMNLVAKEFLAVKGETPGVLILSEMAGASIELSEAIIINPNDIKQIEQAIVQALQMPVDEQMKRLRKMQKVISIHTVKKWASDFLEELIEVCDKNRSLNKKEIDENKRKEINKAYTKASHRLLVLDYDGTLVEFQNDPDEAYPDENLLTMLKCLSSDKANHVIISSGRDRFTLDKWFGHLDIDMAAEHGAAYKEHGKWHGYIKQFEWDDEILRILEAFVDKTLGSYLEKKETALVWHYRSVDEWFGSLREQQLINALISPCNRHGLEIMRGNKIVEIKSPLYSKGSEIKRLLTKSNYDFILSIGDDVTDEDMFRELPADAYSVKVGSISDFALYNIPSQTDVIPFLKSICLNEK